MIRYHALLGALLASSAIVRMAPDGGGEGGLGADATTAQPAPLVQPAPPSPGRIVTVFAGDNNKDGYDGERTAAAVITKVYEDGSVNLRVFSPNGGADTSVTGARRKPDVDAMEDGADKNAAISNTWDWPARV